MSDVKHNVHSAISNLCSVFPFIRCNDCRYSYYDFDTHDRDCTVFILVFMLTVVFVSSEVNCSVYFVSNTVCPQMATNSIIFWWNLFFNLPLYSYLKFTVVVYVHTPINKFYVSLLKDSIIFVVNLCKLWCGQLFCI